MLILLNTIRTGIIASLFAVIQASIADTGTTTVSNEPILPIPLYTSHNTVKAALGAKLYSDPRLSHDISHSCASCHRLDHGGAENTALISRQNSLLPVVNTPSVFNALFNYRHGWFGSSRTLEAQIELGLRHMSTDRSGKSQLSIITERLNQDSEYRDNFTHLYGKSVNLENLTDAIGEFVKSLITPNARFDQYLRGEESAITEEEKQGYALFKEYGCVSCHQGVNVGGNLYQKFGIFYKYFAARGNNVTADNGLFNVTGRRDDLHVFRVPSLRNVELTPPYLHDGEAGTLEQAVEIMGRTQLGKFLEFNDIENIVKFLKTLTGEFKGRSLRESRG